MDEYSQRPVESSGYKCISCGYELSGSAIGGFCPECGRPVEETIRAYASQGGGNNSSSATLALVLGIIGIAACGLVAPFAIWIGYRAKDDIARGIAPVSSGGLATAGIVLGWIGTVLTILSMCVFFAIIASGV